MPFIDDYSPDEQEQDQLTGGSKVVGASKGTENVQATPQKEPEFVGWDRFVAANKDVSNREANKIHGQAAGEAGSVSKTLDEASRGHREAINSNYQGYKPPEPVRVKPDVADPGAASAPFGQPNVKPAPNAQDSGQVDPTKIKTTTTNGQAKNEGVNLAGAKDLEAQLGKDAWAKLLGDTQKAQDQVDALKSEAGVQALLQQKSQPLAQNGAFDAALINGQGQQGFRELNQKYGNNQLLKNVVRGQEESQDRWSRLMKDVDKAVTTRQTGEGPAAIAPVETEPVQEDSNIPEFTGTNDPDTLTYLFPDAADFDKGKALAHVSATIANPIDQADMGLAELTDNDWPLTDEVYVKIYSNFSGGGDATAFARGRLIMAIQRVSGWGQEAQQRFITALKKDPNLLITFLNYQNPGYAANRIKEWFKANGIEAGKSQIKLTKDTEKLPPGSQQASSGSSGAGQPRSSGPAGQ